SPGPQGAPCAPRIHQRITKRHFSLSSDDECREAILASIALFASQCRAARRNCNLPGHRRRAIA
ncbi:hypothetical protein JTL56_33835, partial [Pseudomonas aeruginosa]|nr:hypothetical protein [Pseudomonas aeruginosa]